MSKISKIQITRGARRAGAFSQCSHRLISILQHHQQTNEYSLKSVQDANNFLRYQRLRHKFLKFIGRGYPERLFFCATSKKRDIVGHSLFQHTHESLKQLPETTCFFDNDTQYSEYKEIKFDALTPYIAQYFLPSVTVQKLAVKLKEKYSIEPKDTYVLHYRRFDKSNTFTENKGIETTPPSIDEFIDKFQQIYQEGKKIVLLTIDTEMRNRFRQLFPHTINITEGYVPVQSHKNQSLQHKINRIYSHFINSQELEYLFAQVYLLSQSHAILTTSGNIGLWLVLYRGQMNNVYQYLNHDRFSNNEAHSGNTSPESHSSNSNYWC